MAGRLMALVGVAPALDDGGEAAQKRLELQAEWDAAIQALGSVTSQLWAARRRVKAMNTAVRIARATARRAMKALQDVRNGGKA